MSCCWHARAMFSARSFLQDIPDNADSKTMIRKVTKNNKIQIHHNNNEKWQHFEDEAWQHLSHAKKTTRGS